MRLSSALLLLSLPIFAFHPDFFSFQRPRSARRAQQQSSRRCSRQIVFCKTWTCHVSGQQNGCRSCRWELSRSRGLAVNLFFLLCCSFSRPSANPISKQGANLLAEAAQSLDCQLRKLTLSCTRVLCELFVCYRNARGGFVSSRRMLHIIAGTNLGDDGAVLLGKALESPNCKLTALHLSCKLLSRLWNSLSASDVGHRVLLIPPSFSHSSRCDVKQGM